MSKIHILENEISNLIAAGEVVERPASVVKELVENSIDAGATNIIIEIERGGRALIKITDNGSGMTAEDAPLSVLKHSTSKISTKEDLYAIRTLGFRGEALCSISAVSKFEMISKTADSASGIMIKVEDGIMRKTEIAATTGTVISVKDLFYNTPARLKFLKSEQTENSVILTTVEHLALSNPGISFKLFVNKRESLFTSGNKSLFDSIYSIFGKDFSEMMLPVDLNNVSGYIGTPLYSKPNRNYQIFFVNGRYVHSRILQNVLENSYKNSMLISRYPVCVLFINIDFGEIDINVHPGKLEVKFSNDQAVEALVGLAISKALTFDSGRQEIEMPKKEKISIVDIYPKTDVKDSISEPTPKEESVKNFSDWKIITSKSEKETSLLDTLTTVSDMTEPKPLSVCDYKYEQEQIEKSIDINFIGEVFNAYIIIQKDQDILFIDKHALHERMNFEKLKTKKIEVQTLLTPMVLSLGRTENIKILENVKTLETLGFDIEDYGNNIIIIRQIPQLLNIEDVEYVLNKFVNDLCSKNSIFDEFLYDIACKASIKSGMETSKTELLSLVKTYLENEDILKYCPHGRPIVFTISKNTIDKQFKRIL